MDNRMELQKKLQEILSNVYFQPPSNIHMEYPAILYHLSSIKSVFADNKMYQKHNRYELLLICKNPDNDYYIEKILNIPKCVFDRSYVKNNLYHYTFTLFF